MTDVLSALTSWTAAGAWLVRMTVAGVVVLAAAFVFDRLLARRVAAGWRSALYVAVFVRLALPLDWSSPLGLVRGLNAKALAAPTAVTLAPAARGDADAARANAPTSPRRIPAPLLAWIAGTVALSGAAVVARWSLARELRTARPARERLVMLASGLRVDEHDARGPAAHGVFRPRVVVPERLVDALDDDELRGVLRHEAAHVRRRDPLRLALLELATFIGWPLLPAWLAAWRIRGLMEQACDEEALRGATTEDRRHFGRALVAVAAWQPLRSRFAVAMLPFGGGVRARISALRFTRRWPRGVQAASGLAGAAVALFVLAARANEAMSPSASGHVPPIVEMSAAVFVGAGDSLGLPPTSGDAIVARVVPADEMPRLWSDMSRDLRPAGQTLFRAWLGESRSVRIVPLDDLLSPRALDPIVLDVAALIDGRSFLIHCAARAGVASLPMSSHVLDSDTGLLLRRPPDSHGESTWVLLSPMNVVFDPEGARVDSPRITTRVHGSTMTELLAGLRGTLPTDVIVEPASAGEHAVTLELADVPLESFLEAVAADAGLEPVMRDGALVFAERARPSDASLTPEMARSRPSGDRAAPPLALARPAVTLRATVVTMPRSAARDVPLLSATLDGWSGPGFAHDSELSGSLLEDTLHGLARLEAHGRARILSRPIVRALIGETAEISTAGSDGSEMMLRLTPSRDGGLLILRLEASVTEGGEHRSGAGSSGVPTVFAVSGSGTDVTFFVIEADEDDPAAH